MKTRFLPIALLFSLTMSSVKVAYSQVPDEIIPIDYQTNRDAEIKKTVSHEKTFMVRVTNLNRSIFKVESSKTETNFNISPPSVFSSIKAPSFINFGVSKVQNLAFNGASIPSEDDIKGNIDYNIEELNKGLTQLQKLTSYQNDLFNLSKDCSLDETAWLKKLFDNTRTFFMDPALSNTPNASLQQTLNNVMVSAKRQVEGAVLNLERATSLYYTSSIATKTELLDEQQDNLEELNRDFLNPAIKEKDKPTEETINKTKSSVNDIKGQLLAVEVANGDLKTIIENAKKVIEQLEKENRIEVVNRTFAVLKNPSNFRFESEVIKATKDETVYKVTIQPTELLPCAPLDKKEITVKVRTKGGFKADFSSGLFVNGGGDKFMGRTYYYDNIDANTRKIVETNNGHRMMLSVGALLHGYWRTGTAVKPGLSVGASTTAEFSDLNFHGGLSAIIGLENRLIITGGATLKSSKMLDRGLQTGVVYENLHSPDEIPTVSVFPQIGWFFSLTYNISQFKSK